LPEGWHDNHAEKNEYTKTPMGVVTQNDTNQAREDGDEGDSVFHIGQNP
jgi:hypothetical protein